MPVMDKVEALNEEMRKSSFAANDKGFRYSYECNVKSWIDDQGSCIIQPRVRAYAYRLIREGVEKRLLDDSQEWYLRDHIRRAIKYWKE